jgi:SAM-dependent methyltransferase
MENDEMNMEIYKQPLYYEIAFSFIDPKEQVDNFEALIRKFSKIRVKRFLDVACGPSFQLREIAKRGYEAVGLDIAPEMLRYLEGKAKEEGVKIETVKADLADFTLETKADFAFIMMGSLDVESNEQFLSHLDSLAASLRRGGLYFIQNVDLDWTKNAKDSWVMERDGIVVETTYQSRLKDILNQICTEEMTLKVNDHGERREFYHKRDLKFIFPQEFKTLVKMNGKFEFLGWWKGDRNTWHLDQPLEKVKELNYNMVLIRRK